MSKKINETRYEFKKINISFHYPKAGWTKNDLKDYLRSAVKVVKNAVFSEPCHCHIRSYISYYCEDSVAFSLGYHGGWRESGDAPEIILEISMLKDFSDSHMKEILDRIVEALLEEQYLNLSWLHVEEIHSGVGTIKSTESHGYVSRPNMYFK